MKVLKHFLCHGFTPTYLSWTLRAGSPLSRRGSSTNPSAWIGLY
ncbi:hypothetical protein WM41_0363 [Corynebacterium simulans]|uniref:Uncharacterized protein n=1 Tax=Corynebacterium simulans TaxID=146827 RepID=A0ABR5VBJ2_9CORY|nr:hypothetical protein WM41_0363 [Corynebacterium simulans]